MKKILVLAGVVLFIVLVIMVWTFFGNFFDFAKNLGDKSSNIQLEEKAKFVGNWETQYIEDDERFVGFNGIYSFRSDGTSSVGGLDSTWDISNNKLVISYYEGLSTLIYSYVFSEGETNLTLTNNAGSLEFVKK
jgi:predicted PurR-regulated permease PerM